MALTLKKIARLGAGRHHDRDGLYLERAKTDNGSWLLRYQRDGVEKWLGLGPLRDFDLEEARERARKARQQLRDGIDPIGVKREQRAAQRLEAARAIDFERAARLYFDQHEAKWTNARHRQQFLSSLEQHVFPTIGQLPVAMIDTPEVLSVLEPIWITKHRTATRLRTRIDNVLDWAKVRGYRTGENPARWKGHLAEVLPSKGKLGKVTHHKALSYDEMPAFVHALSKQQGVAPRAMEFLILCASRTSEVLLAPWSEIDLGARTWLIPAERMKSRKPHRVSLSNRAIEILKSLPRERGNEMVFIGTQAGVGLHKMVLPNLLKDMKVDATTHGMRAAFKTWGSEQTAFPREIIEQCLAHIVGNEAERAYLRSDVIEKRRKLMDAWSAFVTSPKRDASVTPIRQSAKL
ncbi:MAG: tyrosine-type recombinase/integrase [Bradyrhizobium sp.]